MGLLRLQIYKNMTGRKRFETACALHDFAHQKLTSYLTQMHPDWTPRQVSLETAKRFLGESASVLQ
jgi:hypothetical protein